MSGGAVVGDQGLMGGSGMQNVSLVLAGTIREKKMSKLSGRNGVGDMNSVR